MHHEPTDGPSVFTGCRVSPRALLALAIVPLLAGCPSTRRASGPPAEVVSTVGSSTNLVSSAGGGAIVDAGLFHHGQGMVNPIDAGSTNDAALLLLNYSTRDAGDVSKRQALEVELQDTLKQLREATASQDWVAVATLGATAAALRSKLGQEEPDASDQTSLQTMIFLSGQGSASELAEIVEDGALTRQIVGADRAKLEDNSGVSYRDTTSKDALEAIRDIELEKLRARELERQLEELRNRAGEEREEDAETPLDDDDEAPLPDDPEAIAASLDRGEWRFRREGFDDLPTLYVNPETAANLNADTPAIIRTGKKKVEALDNGRKVPNWKQPTPPAYFATELAPGVFVWGVSFDDMVGDVRVLGFVPRGGKDFPDSLYHEAGIARSMPVNSSAIGELPKAFDEGVRP